MCLEMFARNGVTPRQERFELNAKGYLWGYFKLLFGHCRADVSVACDYLFVIGEKIDHVRDLDGAYRVLDQDFLT